MHLYTMTKETNTKRDANTKTKETNTKRDANTKTETKETKTKRDANTKTKTKEIKTKMRLIGIVILKCLLLHTECSCHF